MYAHFIYTLVAFALSVAVSAIAPIALLFGAISVLPPRPALWIADKILKPKANPEDSAKPTKFGAAFFGVSALLLFAALTKLAIWLEPLICGQ